MSLPLLEHLPIELLELILSNITVKADLSALCLVSHRLSTAVTPYLYRDLKLRQFNRASELAGSIANIQSSSGILYTRNLTLGTGDEWNFDFCGRLDDLLQLLPPDSLYRFEYDSVHLPSCQQLIYLWKHQRRLTNLQLDFSLRYDSPSHPSACLEPDYAKYDGYTLQVAVQENSQLIRSLTIRELYIDLGPKETKEKIDYQRILEIVLNDRLEKLIYKAERIPIYKPILQLPALRHLAFHYTLFCCQRFIRGRILAGLTHLELVGCERVERLVYMLDTSNLVSLTFQHVCEPSTAGRDFGDTLSVLKIIEPSKRLEHLVLDCPKCMIGQQRQKLIKSISDHKNSLTCLLISCFYYPHTDMQSVLCAIHECKKLRQLSIPLLSTPSTLLGDYKALITELPNLSVLHFQTALIHYVTQHGDNRFQYLPNTTESNAQIAKEMLMAKNTPPSARLSLLALGIGFKLVSRSRIPAPELQVFRRRPAFTPVEPRRIRDIEPDSDLLDFRFDLNTSVTYEVESDMQAWINELGL